jgi:hypothetical protein
MDPENSRRFKLPPRVAKLLLILSIFPFILAGAFLVTRILRITRGQNSKLAIPFIIFVALFCLLPIAQIFSALRKMSNAPANAPAATPRVGIYNTAAGREFYFPPVRKPGMPWVVGILGMFWAAAIWGLFYTRAPVAVPAVVSVLGIGIFFGLLNLWFKETRLLVNASGIKLIRKLFYLRNTLSLDAGKIIRFDQRPWTSRSQKELCDIQLLLPDEGKIAIIRALDKTEATPLLKEMNEALGKKTL